MKKRETLRLIIISLCVFVAVVIVVLLAWYFTNPSISPNLADNVMEQVDNFFNTN